MSRWAREGPLAHLVPWRLHAPLERWTLEHAYPAVDAPLSFRLRAEPAAASLMFGGDVALHHVEPGANIDQTFGGLAELMRTADARVVNLETQLTSRPDAAGTIGASMRAAPAAIEALSRLAIDVVTCANNHCLDYGPEALAESVASVRSRGIGVVGVTHDSGGAGTIIDVRGIRVGVLGFTDDWRYAAPTPPEPGPLAHEPSAVRRAIASLRPTCDVVALQMHWGYEWSMHPMRWLRDLARSYVEAGADIVACHHAHVPMGVEVWRDGIIAHGLGNLYFGPPSRRMHQFRSSSFLLRVDVSKTGAVSAEVIPVRTRDDGTVAEASGAAADAIRRVVARLSSRIGDDAYGDVIEAWFAANAACTVVLDLEQRIAAGDRQGIRERIHTLRIPRQRWLIARSLETGGMFGRIGAVLEALRVGESDDVAPSHAAAIGRLTPDARRWLARNRQPGRLP